jgi:aryl-alcohol dehydrogenase-like predicted oxidoreductase
MVVGRNREYLAHMRFRTLGRSGLKISEITCGNWLTHEPDRTTESKACVEAALDAGITTFDTADIYGAPAYGAAEEILGATLSGTRRESVQILTKVCLPSGPGPNDRGLSRKHIMESCTASLRRLRTDYVDVYQAHRFDDETPLEETMLAFADLVRAGKVLYVGVSEWTAAQIHAAADLAKQLHVPLISSQPQYSLLWRVIEAEVVPASQELGISQVVFSPIAQGVLTGKYKPGQQVPEGSRATDEKGGGAQFVQRFLRDDLLARVQDLQPIAAELDLSLAQLAVAWVLQNDDVASAIIGASRPEQVTENVKAAGVTIPLPLLERIDEVLGDSVERDPEHTARNAPPQRLA